MEKVIVSLVLSCVFRMCFFQDLLYFLRLGFWDLTYSFDDTELRNHLKSIAISHPSLFKVEHNRRMGVCRFRIRHFPNGISFYSKIKKTPDCYVVSIFLDSGHILKFEVGD